MAENASGGDGGSPQRAIAPVIVVVLIIAVVIVFAIVVAALVFDLAGGSEETPAVDVEWQYDASSGELRIMHGGGDTLSDDNVGRLTVRVHGETTEQVTQFSMSDPGIATPITASELIADASSNNYEAGDVVGLYWESPDGETTATLDRYEIPDGSGTGPGTGYGASIGIEPASGGNVSVTVNPNS